MSAVPDKALGATLTGLAIPGSVFSETALDLPANLSFEDWERTGETLGRIGRACQWWIGDWLNFGERAYGEKYAQAMEATGLDYATLQNYSWVAAHIEMSRRRDVLSWSHHREVAQLNVPDQDRWLTSAEANGWSKSQLRKQLKGTGEAKPSPRPTVIRTERQRQIAEGAKLRTERAVGTCSALIRSEVLKVEHAMLVASPDEIEGWCDVFRDARAALERLEARIRAAKKSAD